jgi:hypothetical protein
MTDQPLDRELLIDLITKEVLRTLAGQLDRCDTPEGVRHVVTNGAGRLGEVHRPHGAQAGNHRR